MTKRFFKIFLSAVIAASLSAGFSSCGGGDEQQKPTSTKKERNFMKKGKKNFDKARFSEAEIDFKKALGENPANARATYNLASTYIKQRHDDLTNKEDSLVREIDKMFAQTSQAAGDAEVMENSFYNRGNIAYKDEDYASAIEMYKNALRRNPENNKARENLRLAQLKQQQQQQNQDQNKDKNKDQQDQNKDQQDQNKDQNQDQNKDQQDQNKDKQDQNKDQQNQQQQQQNQQNQQQNQQQQQQQQGGLSQQNAQQILKAMDDKEAAIRMKVENMKKDKERQAMRAPSGKPW